ncbi:MAG TPA: sulfite oxidase [Xanthobacteraceae bacterium]|nr:sulfite oxidase [Xanthobacteraceae bacterium]
MSTQGSLLGAAAVAVPLAEAEVDDAGLFTLEVQAEPALTTAPASPAGDGGTFFDTLSGKRPLLRLSAQPLNYESPIAYLGAAITPAEAFFVRYNLPEIPTIDAERWTLSVGGEGAQARAALSLADLRSLPAVEVVAVCQCSGNGRRLFDPPVPGVAWGNGAVGCGRWKGARLKDVLDAVGMRNDALEVVFAGADKDASGRTPEFSKSLPLWKAREETTLLAYEMNGEPLPYLHGYPARLVVPGWTATYWVKHVASIAVATTPFRGHWMQSTYRVPLGTFPSVARFASQENAVDTPVTEMMVNALITGPHEGAAVKAQAPVEVYGVAWDGGHGISGVDVSIDGGRTWAAAALGEMLGRFAFRPWRHAVRLEHKGRHAIMARATNRIGQTQPARAIANPSGYHHNAVQRLTLVAR